MRDGLHYWTCARGEKKVVTEEELEYERGVTTGNEMARGERKGAEEDEGQGRIRIRIRCECGMLY